MRGVVVILRMAAGWFMLTDVFRYTQVCRVTLVWCDTKVGEQRNMPKIRI